MSSSASIAESIPSVTSTFNATRMAFPASHRFEDNFWSPNTFDDGDINDYRSGLDVLYQKMQQGCVECDEIAHFLRQRISIEELYASKLTDLSQLKPNPNGFGRDDGASLRQTFENIKSESEQLGSCHRQLADNITVMVLQPLMRFAEEHRRRVQAGMNELDGAVGDFERQIDILDRAHDDYLNKCELADQAESEVMAEKARLNDVDYMIENPRQAFVRLGPLSFSTERDLDIFLGRLQQNIPMEDVRYSLFGVYKHSVNGELLVEWLLQSCREHLKSHRAAEEVGQAMINNGYLKVVGMGSTFQARANCYYQWRRLAPDPEEEEHRKLRAEADDADDVYHQAVFRAEQARMLVEQRLMTYYYTMNQAEQERIEEVRSAFTNLAVALSNVMTVTQAVCDRMVVYLEAMRADFDMQYFVQQYRTGPYSPRPIIYENYYHSPASDQVFGVPIEEQTRIMQTKIPPFVAKCLSLIEKELHTLSNEAKQRMWIAPLQLPVVHRLRCTVNTGEPITLKQLRQFDVNTVVGALRLYLMELPECLCTSHLYEPVKALYRKGGDNVDARFSALRSMLTTMPSSNFDTLNRLISHLYNLVLSTSADDSYLASLGMTLGPSILRPAYITRVNFHDRHPQRLVRDLIAAFRVIFAPMHRSSIVSLGDYSMRRDSQDLSMLAPNVRKRIQEATASHMSDRGSIHSSDSQSITSPFSSSFSGAAILTDEVLAAQPVNLHDNDVDADNDDDNDDDDDDDIHSVSTSWDSDHEELATQATESQTMESPDMIAMINTVSSTSIMETEDVAVKRSLSNDSGRDINVSPPGVQTRDVGLDDINLASPATAHHPRLADISDDVHDTLDQASSDNIIATTNDVDHDIDIRRESAQSFQLDNDYDPESPNGYDYYEEHNNEREFADINVTADVDNDDDDDEQSTATTSIATKVAVSMGVGLALHTAMSHLHDPSSLEEPSPNSSEDESEDVRQGNRAAALAALLGSSGDANAEEDSNDESDDEAYNPLEEVVSPSFSIYEQARQAMQNKQQQQQHDTEYDDDVTATNVIEEDNENELNAMAFTPTSAGLVPRLEFSIFESDDIDDDNDDDLDFGAEDGEYPIDEQYYEQYAPHAASSGPGTQSATSSILWFSDSESGEDEDDEELEANMDAESTSEETDVVVRRDSPDSAATSLSEAEPIAQEMMEKLMEKALKEVDDQDVPNDDTMPIDDLATPRTMESTTHVTFDVVDQSTTANDVDSIDVDILATTTKPRSFIDEASSIVTTDINVEDNATFNASTLSYEDTTISNSNQLVSETVVTEIVKEEVDITLTSEQIEDSIDQQSSTLEATNASSIETSNHLLLDDMVEDTTNSNGNNDIEIDTVDTTTTSDVISIIEETTITRTVDINDDIEIQQHDASVTPTELPNVLFDMDEAVEAVQHEADNIASETISDVIEAAVTSVEDSTIELDEQVSNAIVESIDEVSEQGSIRSISLVDQQEEQKETMLDDVNSPITELVEQHESMEINLTATTVSIDEQYERSMEQEEIVVTSTEERQISLNDDDDVNIDESISVLTQQDVQSDVMLDQGTLAIMSKNIMTIDDTVTEEENVQHVEEEDESIVTAAMVVEEEETHIVPDSIVDEEEAVTADLVEEESIITAATVEEEIVTSNSVVEEEVVTDAVFDTVTEEEATDAVFDAAIEEEETAVVFDTVTEEETTVVSDSITEEEEIVTAAALVEAEEITVVSNATIEEETVITAAMVTEEEEIVTADALVEEEAVVVSDSITEEEETIAVFDTVTEEEETIAVFDAVTEEEETIAVSDSITEEEETIAVSDSITEEEETIAVSDSITEEEEPVITTTTIEEETTLVSDATIEEEPVITTTTIEGEEKLTLSTSTTCEHEDESDIDAVEKVISTVSDVVTVEEEKMITVESTSLMPTPTFPDDDDMFSVIQTAIHTRLPESDEEVDDEHYHIKNDGFSLSSDLLMRNYTTDPYISLSDSEYDEPVELDHTTDSLSKSYNNDTDHDDVDYSGRYMSIRTIVSPPSPSLSFNDEDDTAEHGNHHNDGYLNGITRQLQVNALNTTDGSLVVEKFEDDATFSDVASDMDELNTGRISPASSSFMEKLSLLANAHPMTTTTTDLVEHTEDEVDSDEEVDTELMEAKLRAMLNRSTALSDDEQLVIAPQDIPLPLSPSVSITVTDTSIAPQDIPLPPSPAVSITDNEDGEESVVDAFDVNDYQTSTIPPVGKVELPL